MMKHFGLLGLGLTLVMALAMVAPGYAMDPTNTAATSHHSRLAQQPLQVGMVLSITGSGKAYKISDQSTTQTASISMMVKVDRVSLGRALVTVTSGSLTVGSDTMTIDSGRGIVNFHSDRMLLKVTVKGTSGTMHLVLYGKINGHISAPLNVGAGFTVDMLKPQSKLAGKYFLEFPGTSVTRTN
jgi:type 1 glutamine amidotransferase